MKAYKKGFFSKNKTQASLGEIKFNDAQNIEIEDAPLPDEIDWVNISQPYKKKLASKRLSIIFMLALFSLTFLLHFIAQLIFGR